MGIKLYSLRALWAENGFSPFVAANTISDEIYCVEKIADEAYVVDEDNCSKILSADAIAWIAIDPEEDDHDEGTEDKINVEFHDIN